LALIAYSTVLRIGRAAGQSGPPRQAGGRRRIPRARRRCGGQLRSAEVRRPVGHAVGDGQAAVSGPDFCEAPLRGYKAVSQQIREIFAEHTPIIEPLSLDEAYLDVTENLQNIPLARDVAFAIRAKIKEVTGLNASAGISYNKFLAKLASDHRKPNGQYVITPEMGPAFDTAARQIPRDRSGDEREDELARPLHRPRHAQPVA
jgi:nucleotidyltransferase/DNA polymerase involved in DNA repair